MRVAVLLALAAGLSLVPAAAADSPLRAGDWHRLGAVASPGRTGKISLFRIATSPAALAILVTTPAGVAVRGFWSSYCEVNSDDEGTEELQGPIAGSGQLVAYPPVLSGATRCYLSVSLVAPRGSGVAVSEYAS